MQSFILAAIVASVSAFAPAATAVRPITIARPALAARVSSPIVASTGERVLVVGSINVDLYQRLDGGKATFGGNSLSVAPIKGMTLPAASFLGTEAIKAECDSTGLSYEAGAEEALVLSMVGPFEQKTGGKGANAAAAAGQTFACELIGNMGVLSAAENAALLADLETYGQVDVSRGAVLADAPTGTAYILLFDDNDNAIILIGGANQIWPPMEELRTGAEGGNLRAAISECLCLMLQREVPEYVNVVSAQLARSLGKPVFMDVGGTDAPLDANLMPYITVIAPNESELGFISGVQPAEGGEWDAATLRKAVGALKGQFAEVGNPDVEVLVTLGKNGACLYGARWSAESAEAHELQVDAVPGVKPLDTCGAGDCFRGAFVGARYGEGRGAMEAMEWAAAAGSLAVEVEGAMPSMPTRAQISERLADAKKR